MQKKPPLPIVYLHGLFGDTIDFDEMRHILPGHALLLPGHGREESGFDLFEEVFRRIQPFTPCILIGYSLGGRIALQLQRHHPELFPQIICLASHLGIQSQEERRTRKVWEDLWARRFTELSKEDFFEAWYAQPLFHTFRLHPEYQNVLKRRMSIDLKSVLEVFEQTRRSVTEANGYIPKTYQAHFLVGKEDAKFLQHYQEHLNPTQYSVIEQSGHCLHIENPLICSQIIQSWLENNHDHCRAKTESRMEVRL